MASKSGMFLSALARKELLVGLDGSNNDDSGGKEQESSSDIYQDNMMEEETGCLGCGADDDHANLMLCEGCNAEYHPYCLDPPLPRVPQDDWYCARCVKESQIVGGSSTYYSSRRRDTDGLDELVRALPPEFASRFGEICWAQGGIGFGWWPACIFDPRLTEGNTRQQARKNLGKRHLIYFFECHDLPFAVLSNKKITSWIEGMAESYHMGKAAKTAGKQRFVQFQAALQAAMMEDLKPIEARLEWNNNNSGNNNYNNNFQQQQDKQHRRQQQQQELEQQRQLSSSGKLDHFTSSIDNHNESSPPTQRRRSSITGDYSSPPHKRSRTITATTKPPSSTKRTTTRGRETTSANHPVSSTSNTSKDSRTSRRRMSASRGSPDRLKQRLSLSNDTSNYTDDNNDMEQTPLPSSPTVVEPTNTKNVNHPQPQSTEPARPLQTQPQPQQPQHGPFFCRILRRLEPITDTETIASSNAAAAAAAATDAGEVPATAKIVNIGFVRLESRMDATLGDARNAITNELVPEFLPEEMKWSFFLPSLGPVSSKQEKYLGKLLPLLEDAAPDTTIGKGSIRDPVVITIIESSTVRRIY